MKFRERYAKPVGNYKVDFPLLNRILKDGLCDGAGETYEGEPTGQVCVEQAVAIACGFSVSDQPECTLDSVRAFGVAMNDSGVWDDEDHRAKGMKGFAIAQIGSADVTNRNFNNLLRLEVQTVLLPALIEEKIGVKGLPLDELRSASNDEEVAVAVDKILTVLAEMDGMDSCEATEAIDEVGRIQGMKAPMIAECACAYAAGNGYERWMAQHLMDCAVEALKKMKSPGAEYLKCGVKKK